MCSSDLADRVAAAEFDLLLLTAGVEEPGYPDYAFGLPEKTATQVRRQYREVGVRAGLHVYVRKSDAATH